MLHDNSASGTTSLGETVTTQSATVWGLSVVGTGRTG